MKENSIKEDITRIKQRIEDVKEYIEYGLPYSEYLDLENSFDNILSDYKRVLQVNEKYKEFFDLMLRLDSDYFMNCGDEETNKLVDEILKLESE